MTKNELKCVSRVLKNLLELDSRMSLGQALTLMAVAKHDGADQATITKEVGLSKSTASRSILIFSKVNHLKEKGLGFIETRRDPMALDHNTVHLTAKGKQFIEEL